MFTSRATQKRTNETNLSFTLISTYSNKGFLSFYLSTHHELTSGISSALLVLPALTLNGRGAHSNAIPVWGKDKKLEL